MNGAQLHLAINHVPVVLCLVCAVILGWGWFKASSEIKKVGLVFLVGAAIFSGLAYLTGEPAEDVIKDRPGFSENRIEEHEDAALFALIATVLAGSVAAISLFANGKNQKLSNSAFLIAFVLTLFCSAIFLRTAHLGGLIQHEEIRP